MICSEITELALNINIFSIKMFLIIQIFSIYRLAVIGATQLSGNEDKLTRDLIRDLNIQNCLIIQDSQKPETSLNTMKMLSRLGVPTAYKPENELHDYIKNQSYVNANTMIIYKTQNFKNLTDILVRLKKVSRQFVFAK